MSGRWNQRFFASTRGRVLTLLRRDSRTVDVHVRWLREKIEVDPSEPVRIVTVRGAGYRFEG